MIPRVCSFLFILFLVVPVAFGKVSTAGESCRLWRNEIRKRKDALKLYSVQGWVVGRRLRVSWLSRGVEFLYGEVTVLLAGDTNSSSSLKVSSVGFLLVSSASLHFRINSLNFTLNQRNRELKLSSSSSLLAYTEIGCFVRKSFYGREIGLFSFFSLSRHSS